MNLGAPSFTSPSLWNGTRAFQPARPAQSGRVMDERLLVLGQTVREVAAELTVALGGVMPEAKPA
jgi:hypothetical protein